MEHPASLQLGSEDLVGVGKINITSMKGCAVAGVRRMGGHLKRLQVGGGLRTLDCSQPLEFQAAPT